MDQEKVRKALDHFENDEFVDAKEILSQEIQSNRDAHLKNKLGLKGDFNPAPAPATDGEGDGEGEE